MFFGAIVRSPSPSFADGTVSPSPGAPNCELALRQHKAYCNALVKCGIELIRLEPDAAFPQSTFIEHTAVSHGRAFVARGVQRFRRDPRPRGRRVRGQLLGRERPRTHSRRLPETSRETGTSRLSSYRARDVRISKNEWRIDLSVASILKVVTDTGSTKHDLPLEQI